MNDCEEVWEVIMAWQATHEMSSGGWSISEVNPDGLGRERLRVYPGLWTKDRELTEEVVRVILLSLKIEGSTLRVIDELKATIASEA